MHVDNILMQPSVWPSILLDYVLQPSVMLVLCLLSIFVVLGNLLVVSAIWHENQLHSVTNYLIASLAAADCLVGAIVMPFSVISEVIIGSWTFGALWCDLWHSFDVLASTASIMNLCAISLDRYLAITNPISYQTKMTPRRILLLIISIWTCSSLISFPAILWWRAVGQAPLQELPREELPKSPSRPQNYSARSNDKISTSISTVEFHHSDDSPAQNAQGTNSNKTSDPSYRCVFPDDTYYLLFSSIVSFYGPLCVMLYAYYRIYKAAVQQTRFLKHGSKQVMIGGRKKNKRLRYTSEHSYQSTAEGNRLTETTCDGAQYDSNDGQHLVLRAHRGGGGTVTSGAKKTKSNLKSDNSIKNNQKDRELTRTDCDYQKKTVDGLKDSITSSINFETTSLVEKNQESTRLSSQVSKVMNSMSIDSVYCKRAKMRVISQRFDKIETSSQSAQELESSRGAIQPGSNERISDKTRRDNHEFLNHRLSDEGKTGPRRDIDSITRREVSLMGKMQPAFGVASQNRVQPDDSRSETDSAEVVCSSTDQTQLRSSSQVSFSGHLPLNYSQSQSEPTNVQRSLKNTTAKLDIVDEDRISEVLYETDTDSSSSAATYGTGSISSVLMRCQRNPERSNVVATSTVNEISSRPTANQRSHEAATLIMRRAMSVGDAGAQRRGNDSADYKWTKEEKFAKIEEDDKERMMKDKAVSIEEEHGAEKQQADVAHMSDNSYRRANSLRTPCDSIPLALNHKIANGQWSGAKAAKSGRTLDIRSWVKLTRLRKSNEMTNENGIIKTPRSLVSLMMMNSDTSTDSSTLGGALESLKRRDNEACNLSASKDGCMLLGDCEDKGRGPARTQLARIEMEDDGKCDATANRTDQDSGIDHDMNLKTKSKQLTKNLSFGHDLNPKKEKAQVLYYNSDKIIHSIVDLTDLKYIDYATNNQGHHQRDDSLKMSEHGDTLNGHEEISGGRRDRGGEGQRIMSDTQTHLPRQQRSVGKKLTKLAKERKAAKTLGIVVGVFILCWLPFFVVNIIVALCGTRCLYKPQILLSVVTWLGWLNSAMNPVIYACWSRDFRRAFRRVLCTWVEFLCPYDGAKLARKLRLKKCSNYSNSGQEAHLARTMSTKCNTSSITTQSVRSNYGAGGGGAFTKGPAAARHCDQGY